MITTAPAPQTSSLRIWFSNLKERILFWLFGLISRSFRYVYIEGDTTQPDSNGDWPVSNAGITLSNRIMKEIRSDTRPYEDEAHPDKYYTLTFIARDTVDACTLTPSGTCIVYHFGFSVCPDLSEYQENPILSPILYDVRWHTFGFQPCTPTVMRMLNDWHLPVSSSVVLPVQRRYDRVNRCYDYYISNPDEVSFLFGLIRRIVIRNTFRYPDKRTIR